MLISLAANSNADEEIAAIACYDIGEFVRNYPNGRSIVKRLGAKEIIMKLIEHDNPELQRHALQCVSKMLVQNWQVSIMESHADSHLIPSHQSHYCQAVR